MKTIPQREIPQLFLLVNRILFDSVSVKPYAFLINHQMIHSAFSRHKQNYRTFRGCFIQYFPIF